MRVGFENRSLFLFLAPFFFLKKTQGLIASNYSEGKNRERKAGVGRKLERLASAAAERGEK